MCLSKPVQVLIAFANCLDPDQDRSGSQLFDTDNVPDFFFLGGGGDIDFEKRQQTTTKTRKNTQHAKS